MSEQKQKPQTPKAFKVNPIVNEGGRTSVLLDEPMRIINEIILNVNAFVDSNQDNLSAMLYLGSAQRYAMRFINPEGLLDLATETFAGIPVLWVDATYHVNLVAKRNAPEQG